jgi:MFS transporter, MHS family, shikimate and dehydroshikimate transport protein
MSSTVATLSGTESQSKSSVAAVVASSVIGNTIEFYDFLVYGFAAAFVLGKLFFPTVSPLSALLASFATFGVGFLFRPLGGIFFGHLGDTLGRKTTLVITLLTMGFATVLIGVLPTYEQIGIAAPFLLVILRCIQGFALGGEWGGAVVMVVENAPRRFRGLLSALPQTGGYIAQFLGGGSFALLAYLPDDQMMSWGWRLPFLASAILILIGFLIRSRLDETEAFKSARKKNEIGKALPLVDTIRTAWRRVLLCMLLRFAELGPFFLVSVFTVSYATTNLGIEKQSILSVLMTSCAIAIPAHAFWGAMADKVGRRRMFIYSSIFGAIVSFPFFYLLETKSYWWMLLGYILLLNIAQNAPSAVQPAFYTELFPARMRYTGASMGSGLGAILAGGFLPFIAKLLTTLDFNPTWYPVAAYLAVTCLISALAAYLGPDTSGAEIEVEADKLSR